MSEYDFAARELLIRFRDEAEVGQMSFLLENQFVELVLGPFVGQQEADQFRKQLIHVEVTVFF